MTLAEIRDRIDAQQAKRERDALRAKRIQYRQRILPSQLTLARAKLAMLEREAAELGMTELL